MIIFVVRKLAEDTETARRAEAHKVREQRAKATAEARMQARTTPTSLLACTEGHVAAIATATTYFDDAIRQIARESMTGVPADNTGA